MSFTATLKLESMTDSEIVARMCARQGWKCAIFEKAQRANIEWTNRQGYAAHIVVDMKHGQVRYDTDFETMMQERLLRDRPQVSRSDSVAQQLTDLLDVYYQEAATIVGAERLGRTWREGKTSEGYTWIEVADATNKLEALVS